MVVLDLVTGALRDIAVIGQTATPSADQGADAVTRLNQLMASLEGDDIVLGYNPKATTAEALVLPPEHVETIRALLAVALADSYGIPVPPVVGAKATNGYSRLLREAIYNVRVETRTDNAPRGNAQSYTYNIETGS